MQRATSELRAAVEELWRIRPPGPDNLFTAPAFVRLAASIREGYHPDMDQRVFPAALGNALRSLGLPCWLPANRQRLSLPAATAAMMLHAALRARHSRRSHLIPLDHADDLPTLKFGPARLRRFRPEELRELVEAERLKRVFPEAEFDAERFSEFQWLVIEETVDHHAKPPEERAVPFLFEVVNPDYGRIEPHKGQFPDVVEDALFFLLLAPWEDWSQYPQVDWRGFRVPWVYTADDDLFVQPQRPSSPDDLRWEPQATDASGEVVEDERPAFLPLKPVDLRCWNEQSWRMTAKARKSPLFETPVVHFVVRAFLADGVDEMLAHLTAIEAALGLQADYKKSMRPKPDRHPGTGPTDRVAIPPVLWGNAVSVVRFPCRLIDQLLCSFMAVWLFRAMCSTEQAKQP
jgi:hypothetical protein